ncbi:MAG TPA: efflux RND transporter periplasmic adaptor subunit [Novimethylophilus sp.]|jgi:HlyD family secretion protein|uniref:HlyD family secretion protein n=1 Tax=Novimethylophilus sp. TaxID=2137426 RepID=UPI002F3F9E03
MRHRWYFLVAGLALIAASAFAAWFYFLQNRAAEGVLEANGQVRGTEVTISSKLAGRIETLPIAEGQLLKKGNLVAKLTSAEVEAQLEQAAAQASAADSRVKEIEAALKAMATSVGQAQLNVGATQSTSQHTIHQANEGLQRAQAELAAAQAVRELEKNNYDRNARLVQQGFVSESYFDQLKSRYASAEARLKAAERAREEASAALELSGVSQLDIGVRQKEVQRLQDEKARLQASRAVAQSQAEAARARVREMQAVASDTGIRAPADGTIINKLVEQGELVASGTPIATMIDLSDIYIRVYIPEQAIGLIRIGNPARIFADAFPQRFFPGRVVEVSQQAEFTPKEVHTQEERTKLVFGVKVKIDNPEGYLKPGMPVDVTIKWRENMAWPERARSGG